MGEAFDYSNDVNSVNQEVTQDFPMLLHRMHENDKLGDFGFLRNMVLEKGSSVRLTQLH